MNRFPPMPKRLCATVCAALAALVCAASAGSAQTLAAIKQRGMLACGVSEGIYGFSNETAAGWAGAQQPSFSMLGGLFAAIPFAIWFFLAIEGAAMAAEEARDPKRTIPRAYIFGILTLVALAFGTMIFAGAVGDWARLANINDPLPQAMKIVVGAKSGWLHLLVWIGLLGLIEDWRIDYNTNRPHSAHGDLTPNEFAQEWITRNQPALA